MILKYKLEKGAVLPSYATPGSAGFDLVANEDGSIFPCDTLIVSTGLSLEIPSGYEGQVRPRSGLAAKYGVTVMNSPGTIDSDYRGVIKVILYNSGGAPFNVRKGDRIAQMVIAPVSQVAFEAASLGDTERGSGGLGSTGV